MDNLKITVTVQFHNELEFLPHFFESVQYADEIICGAHSPTDGSLEFVEKIKETSKVPIEIFHFPEDTIYKHGFSFIKNELIKHATGDWIVSLDADEEMDMTKESILPFIRGETLAIATRTQHMTEIKPHWTLNDTKTIKKEADWINQRHWRIFRNHVGIHWMGLIHEELRDRTGRHVSRHARNSNICMYHYGAMANKDKRGFKNGLYAELLSRIVENPELREGTNHYWYEQYYLENIDQIVDDRDDYLRSRNVISTNI